MSRRNPTKRTTSDEAGQASLLATIHGIFYLITGIWPLVSIGTFQTVTGPKTDLWLVKTVGALIAIDV